MMKIDKIQGFTLLELIIAMALSALVMSVLAIGMNTVLKDWERSNQHLEVSLEASLTALQIERALEGAFPHLYFDQDDNKNYLFFEGKENELAWVSTVSPGRTGGLTAWSLKADKKTGVELRIAPAFANDPSSRLEKADPLQLFENHKVSFEYFYFDERFPKDAQWFEKWSAKELQGLPDAVRIRLESPQVEQAFEIIGAVKASEHLSMRRTKP